jgi:hypothetical protein
MSEVRSRLSETLFWSYQTMNGTLFPAVILSEAKNLGSILDHRPHGNELEMFESLASCFAFRCSASLNMTARLCVPKFLAIANVV